MDYYMLDNDFQTNINYRIICGFDTLISSESFYFELLFQLQVKMNEVMGYFGELILLWEYFCL